jgi:hypothetical protein
MVTQISLNYFYVKLLFKIKTSLSYKRQSFFPILENNPDVYSQQSKTIGCPEVVFTI